MDWRTFFNEDHLIYVSDRHRAVPKRTSRRNESSGQKKCQSRVAGLKRVSRAQRAHPEPPRLPRSAAPAYSLSSICPLTVALMVDSPPSTGMGAASMAIDLAAAR